MTSYDKTTIRGHQPSSESLEMDQATYVGRTNIRERMIAAIVYIESLPLLRPRWAAFDVAILVLVFLR